MNPSTHEPGPSRPDGRTAWADPSLREGARRCVGFRVSSVTHRLARAGAGAGAGGGPRGGAGRVIGCRRGPRPGDSGPGTWAQAGGAAPHPGDASPGRRATPEARRCKPLPPARGGTWRGAAGRYEVAAADADPALLKKPEPPKMNSEF